MIATQKFITYISICLATSLLLYPKHLSAKNIELSLNSGGGYLYGSSNIEPEFSIGLKSSYHINNKWSLGVYNSNFIRPWEYYDSWIGDVSPFVSYKFPFHITLQIGAGAGWFYIKVNPHAQSLVWGLSSGTNIEYNFKIYNWLSIAPSLGINTYMFDSNFYITQNISIGINFYL